MLASLQCIWAAEIWYLDLELLVDDASVITLQRSLYRGQAAVYERWGVMAADESANQLGGEFPFEDIEHESNSKSKMIKYGKRSNKYVKYGCNAI